MRSPYLTENDNEYEIHALYDFEGEEFGNEAEEDISIYDGAEVAKVRDDAAMAVVKDVVNQDPYEVENNQEHHHLVIGGGKGPSRILRNI